MISILTQGHARKVVVIVGARILKVAHLYHTANFNMIPVTDLSSARHKIKIIQKPFEPRQGGLSLEELLLKFFPSNADNSVCPDSPRTLNGGTSLG